MASVLVDGWLGVGGERKRAGLAVGVFGEQG